MKTQLLMLLLVIQITSIIQASLAFVVETTSSSTFHCRRHQLTNVVPSVSRYQFYNTGNQNRQGINGRSHSLTSMSSNVIDTPNNDTATATALLTDNNSKNDDIVLKEFDKKEAMILKRRNDIQAKLHEYDAVMTQLQTQKAEYIAASQLSKPPAGGSFSETAIRSAVKAFVWRIIAGAVTFITTYQYSHGSIQQAIQVVSADFFSKSLTMFIGERMMNKSQAGRKQGGRDNAQRSLIKALIWRLFAICNTLTMAIFISKDLSIASKIASTDAVFKTALMYGYERIWARINWGKEYIIEFSI